MSDYDKAISDFQEMGCDNEELLEYFDEVMWRLLLKDMKVLKRKSIAGKLKDANIITFNIWT